MNSKVVFMNGEFIPAAEAKVSVMTHGLSYGTGCFEGIRGYWNQDAQQVYLFRAREHYERLHRSCRILSMQLPYSVDELLEISRELIQRNEFHEDMYLRPFIFKADEIIGVRLHGLKDHIVIYSVPMGNYIDIDRGLHCGVSSWRRIDDNMVPARAKISGGYINSAFAKSEALQNGFDEAIMLTADGHVSEGSAENIFVVLNGELVTPPPSENILLGVTRDTIMKLAQRELGRITRERSIDRTELYTADEVLLCGTGAQIAPVTQIDHRPIGNGKIGPLTTELQRLYFEVVRGQRPEYQEEWCTPVYTKVPASSSSASEAKAPGA
ncbi:MAG TPA: branched-chain amino acid transaminase [Ktedonobacterales bacterium]|jgi:branched-chain amino acid aminotransferase